MHAAEHLDLGDIAGYVVHDRQTGTVVHSEYFAAARMTEHAVANRLVRTWESLVLRFPTPRYDVEYGLFVSVSAFMHYVEDVSNRPS